MHIDISGQHVEVTKALRDYTIEKMARIERHIDQITSARVVLCIEQPRQIAKANISVKGGSLNATAESENMYAAIDLLVDKLDQQATRHKEKQQNHQQPMDDEG